MFQSTHTSSLVAKSIIKTVDILNLPISDKFYNINKNWKVYSCLVFISQNMFQSIHTSLVAKSITKTVNLLKMLHY